MHTCTHTIRGHTKVRGCPACSQPLVAAEARVFIPWRDEVVVTLKLVTKQSYPPPPRLSASTGSKGDRPPVLVLEGRPEHVFLWYMLSLPQGFRGLGLNFRKVV